VHTAGWLFCKKGVYAINTLIAQGYLTQSCQIIPIGILNNAFKLCKKGVYANITDCSSTTDVKIQIIQINNLIKCILILLNGGFTPTH
jgi:hypothetical protein